MVSTSFKDYFFLYHKFVIGLSVLVSFSNLLFDNDDYGAFPSFVIFKVFFKLSSPRGLVILAYFQYFILSSNWCCMESGYSSKLKQLLCALKKKQNVANSYRSCNSTGNHFWKRHRFLKCSLLVFECVCVYWKLAMLHFCVCWYVWSSLNWIEYSHRSDHEIYIHCLRIEGYVFWK